MTKTYDTPKPNASRSRPEGEDLSKAIKQSVQRARGEEVRCTRLYGDHYRCNWWVKDEDNGMVGRIIRSRFLKVARSGDGLLIEDLTG